LFISAGGIYKSAAKGDIIMLSMPGWGELLVIFLLILLFFGAKRIPDIATGLGRGIRDFKKALKDTQDEITKDNSTTEKLEDKKDD
jgi:sec-independent protein translocase protein TatA